MARTDKDSGVSGNILRDPKYLAILERQSPSDRAFLRCSARRDGKCTMAGSPAYKGDNGACLAGDARQESNCVKSLAARDRSTGQR